MSECAKCFQGGEIEPIVIDACRIFMNFFVRFFGCTAERRFVTFIYMYIKWAFPITIVFQFLA